MTSTGEFVLLAPASHIIASDFIKLHLLHALLKSLLMSTPCSQRLIFRPSRLVVSEYEVTKIFVRIKCTNLFGSPCTYTKLSIVCLNWKPDRDRAEFHKFCPKDIYKGSFGQV